MKFEFKHKDGTSIASVPDMLLYAMENNENLALCDSNEKSITSNCKLCNKIIEITTDNITFCVCEECKKKLRKIIRSDI